MTYEYRLKCLRYIQSTKQLNSLNCHLKAHPNLLNQQNLDKLALTKSFIKYSDPTIPLTDPKYQTLETLSLLSTYKDISFEYSNNDDLTSLRRSYCFHILNYALQQNAIIEANEDVFKEI